MEEACRRDDEHDFGGLLHRLPEDARQILHPERLRDKEAEEHDVKRSNGRRLRCGEKARKHAADHDDGCQKRKKSILKSLPASAVGRRGFFGVVVLVTHERRPGHEGEAEQQPRDGTRLKKCIDACLRETCIENERDARRNDGTECAARGDRCAAEGAAVARSCHFGNGDHADPGRTSGSGPRHRSHDNARGNGRVGKASPSMPEAHAPKAEKAFRNSAHRHEIPHEKKERNRHERNARDLGKHSLRHEEKPRNVAARKKKRRDGGKAHRDCCGDADKHQHQHSRKDEEHCHERGSIFRISGEEQAPATIESPGPRRCEDYFACLTASRTASIASLPESSLTFS